MSAKSRAARRSTDYQSLTAALISVVWEIGGAGEWEARCVCRQHGWIDWRDRITPAGRAALRQLQREALEAAS